jgi:DNA-binding FadR family transcriptional regulator
MALWYLAGVEACQEVKPTRRTWDRFGVSRHTGRRGLAALERAGLVAVTRARGRAPRVTILEAER